MRHPVDLFENANGLHGKCSHIGTVKKGRARVAKLTRLQPSGEGLCPFCIPGSAAGISAVGLGYGNLGKHVTGKRPPDLFRFLAGRETAAAEGAIGIAEKASCL